MRYTSEIRYIYNMNKIIIIVKENKCCRIFKGNNIISVDSVDYPIENV